MAFTSVDDYWRGLGQLGAAARDADGATPVLGLPSTGGDALELMAHEHQRAAERWEALALRTATAVSADFPAVFLPK